MFAHEYNNNNYEMNTRRKAAKENVKEKNFIFFVLFFVCVCFIFTSEKYLVSDMSLCVSRMNNIMKGKKLNDCRKN